MNDQTDPLAAEKSFFAALLAGNAAALGEIFTDDFIIIDVMQCYEIPRPALLDVIGSGQLKFESIEPDEQRVRRYGDTAIITGRTQMRGRFGGAQFATRSRYTH